MDFNRDFWDRPEEEILKDLGGSGKNVDELLVAIRAVHNAIGRLSDEQAHQGSGKWTRIQAPGAGTENDPSPDTLP